MKKDDHRARREPFSGRHNGVVGGFSWTIQVRFTEDVALEAVVLRKPVRGRREVEAVMTAAGDYYSTLDFTHQTTDGAHTYLEWEATGPTGTPMNGVTVLTRDRDGRIEHVAFHHRPLDAALEFLGNWANGRKD